MAYRYGDVVWADLDSRRAVRVGTIDDAGMEKILGLVLGCLVTPDMTILSGC